MSEIPPEEVQARREAGEQFILLDVRNEQELTIASLDGTINIPMSQVPERLDELDPQKEIIVMCHRGQRSAQIVTFLEASGYGNVRAMAGGINAWSQEVDPDVPMY